LCRNCLLRHVIEEEIKKWENEEENLRCYQMIIKEAENTASRKRRY
jgi:hypothetical protein